VLKRHVTLNNLKSTIMYSATMFQAVQKNSGRQPRVQRVILLSVLAYEAIGAILGGILLIVRPDGRLMNMPVDIMNGVFRDFLLPGYILLGLGILNAIAFLAVLRRNYADWILASLANGGLLIWFVVEIAVLQQTHWLHFIWGFPIVVGSLMMLSLFPVQPATVRKALIICGILSSLIYVVANVVTVILYKGYDPVSQTVSELSAINAPTRPLWDLTLVIYDLFVLAFAWGIWQSPVKKLRIVAGLITIYIAIGFFWPPMHQRQVLAAGGGSLTDTLHIVFTMVTVALMIMIIVFGGVAFGKSFLFYSIATLVILIFFGILTGRDGPEISANLPTPLVGIWERINIGAYMLWIVILAFTLLQREKKLVR
jgi:hypothetical protein